MCIIFLHFSNYAAYLSVLHLYFIYFYLFLTNMQYAAHLTYKYKSILKVGNTDTNLECTKLCRHMGKSLPNLAMTTCHSRFSTIVPQLVEVVQFSSSAVSCVW